MSLRLANINRRDEVNWQESGERVEWKELLQSRLNARQRRMTVQHGARSFITTFEDEFSVRFINGITDIHRVFISSGWQREPSRCLRISAVTQ